ncbi:MAG TPA: sigma factor-like helix-turn-helix DNA-binding protein [Planctomycetota bacterium]|nr:sigma factor-like helix-turn-helix DNA-binding protein [Planctomycetota bacterium]
MSGSNRERDKKLMRQAIQRVPEEYREVLLAMYTQKISADDLAESLNLSRATVDQRLKDGTVLLRKVMRELQDEA